MDWNAAIEKNREALKRILAALAAMAGLGAIPTSPLVGEDGSARRGEAETLAEPGEGYLPSRAPTLPRHLYLAVLRLLRPAESAARRLIVVAARGLTVALPPSRPRKPKPKSAFLRKPGGTGIWSPRGARPASVRAAPARLSLPLLDPLHTLRRRRPVATGVPRISFPGYGQPFPIPVRRPASPDDPIDATRLVHRLAALAAALDDLPRQARRLARWRARSDRLRDQGLFGRVRPLRPGRPPGQRPASCRRRVHEVHDVLAVVHGLAHWALQVPDTS